MTKIAGKIGRVASFKSTITVYSIDMYNVQPTEKNDLPNLFLSTIIAGRVLMAAAGASAHGGLF